MDLIYEFLFGREDIIQGFFWIPMAVAAASAIGGAIASGAKNRQNKRRLMLWKRRRIRTI